MEISAETKLFMLRLTLFIVYLAVGAAVFQALESDYQHSDLEKLRALRENILSKYNISKKDEDILINHYKVAARHMYGSWTYGNSFVFASTTLTTIGESASSL